MQSVTFEFSIKLQLIFFDSKSIVSMLKYTEDVKANIETRMYKYSSSASPDQSVLVTENLRHCMKADDPAIEKQMR